jgi:hypothetical protein
MDVFPARQRSEQIRPPYRLLLVGHAQKGKGPVQYPAFLPLQPLYAETVTHMLLFQPLYVTLFVVFKLQKEILVLSSARDYQLLNDQPYARDHHGPNQNQNRERQ